MIALCERCAGKISDAYTLVHVREGKECFICHGTDAMLYDFIPKRVLQRKQATVSAGTRADRTAYESRRRWA